MKYIALLVILFPMIVLAAVPGPNPSGTSTPGPNPSQVYLTKNCDNKCTKTQECVLIDDGKYYCTTKSDSIGSSEKTTKPLEVYISCKTIDGLFKGKCSSDEITVSAISGKTEIPIREYKPGQCCILKSKLKVH
jgi:hypothetical protein